MALINCTECEKEISDKANTCPHCGAPNVLPDREEAQARQKRFELERKLNSIGTKTTAKNKPPQNELTRPLKAGEAVTAIVGGGIVVAVIVGIYIAFSGSPSSNTSPSTMHSEAGAWVMCQNFVEQRLRAPSTAKFPWGYRDYVSKIGAQKYKVDAYVDAENAFGGTIRTEFQCTVSYIGNEKWRLDDLKM